MKAVAKYDIEMLMSVDNLISTMIDELTSTNPFFQKKNLINKDIYSALYIAFNWGVITKTFLFTTISSLGKLSYKLSNDSSPTEQMLQALQIGFSIISDDLNNTHFIFKQNAPSNGRGIHYKWWESSILSPLKLLLPQEKLIAMQSTLQLTEQMKELAKKTFGAAIQLRIVESIAYNICKSFFILFSNLRIAEQRVFKKKDLIWITAHLQAEGYHKKMSEGYSGIIGMLPYKNLNLFLKLTQSYIDLWKNVLSEFAMTNAVKKYD